MKRKKIERYQWQKPTHAWLTFCVDKEAEEFLLPITEAAWLARQLYGILTGDDTKLFHVGDKVTLSRYNSGRYQIILTPASQNDLEKEEKKDE